MKTNLIHKIAFAADGSIRLATATLLLLCVIAISSGIVSADLPDNETCYVSSDFIEISGLPILPVNGMTGHGNRPVDGVLCINATSLLQTDNSGKRQRKDLIHGCSTVKNADNQQSDFAVCAAFSLVNSQLGNQFTLVGAKPSGTS